MNSHDPHEAQRRASVEDFLETSNIDLERRTDEALQDVFEAILELKTGGPAIPNPKTTSNQYRSASIASSSMSGTSTISALELPSPSASSRIPKAATPLAKAQYGPVKGLPTPSASVSPPKERDLNRDYPLLMKRVSQVESNVRGPLSAQSTPSYDSNNSLSPKEPPRKTSMSTSKTGTPDPEVMTWLTNLDEAVNWRDLKALTDVACAVVGHNIEDLTMEKLEATRIPLKLDPHHWDGASTMKRKFGAVPEWKGPPAIRDDTEKKLQEQIRRTGGIMPATALGVVPGAPSVMKAHLFSPQPKPRLRLSAQLISPPTSSPIKASLSTSSPEINLKRESDSYKSDSDRTEADPNWTQSESEDMKSPVTKKPKVRHYNGPRAWMLDESRNDPVAMALHNRSDYLSDFMSINCPTRMSDRQSKYLDPGPFNRSKRMSESDIGSDTPTRAARREIPGLDGSYDCLADFDRMKAERRKRDEQEMYEGLKNFKGRQRGWNGEHESIRSKTLSDHEKAESLKLCEQIESEHKGKDSIIPRKQRSELNYAQMSKDRAKAAKAKHLEEGYFELAARAIQSGMDFDDYLEANSEEIRRQMGSRKWDLDAIKKEALGEQRAKIAGAPQIKLKLSIHNESKQVSNPKKIRSPKDRSCRNRLDFMSDSPSRVLRKRKDCDYREDEDEDMDADDGIEQKRARFH